MNPVDASVQAALAQTGIQEKVSRYLEREIELRELRSPVAIMGYAYDVARNKVLIIPINNFKFQIEQNRVGVNITYVIY